MPRIRMSPELPLDTPDEQVAERQAQMVATLSDMRDDLKALTELLGGLPSADDFEQASAAIIRELERHAQYTRTLNDTIAAAAGLWVAAPSGEIEQRESLALPVDDGLTEEQRAFRSSELGQMFAAQDAAARGVQDAK